MQRFGVLSCPLPNQTTMKKNNLIAPAVLLLLFSAFVFSGCIKDDCKKLQTYTFYQPVYKTTAQVKAEIVSGQPRDIENPGKLYIRGGYIFLNEIDKGVHIIDNRNPKQPKNVAFISIPGNLDMAVKGDALYADLYTDLVTIDISNPLQVQVKKYIEGVFPYRTYVNGFYNDTTRIIADWIRRDTTVVVSCNSDRNVEFFDNSFLNFSSQASSGKAASSPVGMGGSMARFAITTDRMYTVSNSDLNVFNISSVFDAKYQTKVQLDNWQIETIFPLKDKLFIGSQSGMFIYSVSNPDKPVKTGQFAHITSCDPVIADDHYAYVTLRSGTACQGFTNQLDVLLLNGFTDPKYLQTYNMTNPHGLSKDGGLLFVCDGADGLKVFDASNVSNMRQIKHFKGMDTYDVIAYNNIAIVVAKDGLYQFDYSNVNNIRLISKLTIHRT